MKRILGFAVALALLLASPAAAQQRGLSVQNSSSEPRVALVIGNGAYQTSPLKNPVHDAKDIAQALRELGFEVSYRENQNLNDMKRAIRAFGEKLRGGGIGLFYYAGHGVQVQGINYLVPVDAKVESEEEVEYEAVEAGFVLAQMESAKNSLNIVILDACRNNPFARSFRSASRGLATISAPSGTLVAYATAPGSVASDGTAHNGLYTQELLKFMRTPGLGIEHVFKQVRISVLNQSQGKQTPWESSSLIGDFYFTKKAAPELPETEASCLNEPRLRSMEPALGTSFTLTNESKVTLVAYWLDAEGKRQRYFELAPNQKVEQPTYTTHPWVITTAKGRCIRILFAPGDYVIRSSPESSETIYSSSADLKPAITSKEKAQYTDIARKNGVEGTVMLSAVFTAEGKVTDIRIIRGLPDGLNDEAKKTAEQIKFSPAIKDGRPVSVRITLEFSFQLY